MAFVQDNWMIIAVMVTSGAMLLWLTFNGGLASAREIGTTEATRLINRNDAMLLDLRESADFDGQRLPNAVHLPLSQLDSRGGELAKYRKRPVIAYGGRANQSRAASRALVKQGFGEVFVLRGGVRAWKDAGLPLEKA